MTLTSEATADEHRPLPEEAGTAPGDRRFRPDIQGLRAVAVLLVVFYHAGFTELSGGYVGVDVFYVISGFVITGLLLRERGSSGRTSLLGFYGRRSRRIIPAATVVIIAAVVMTYARLGVVFGNQTAVDARWTSVFLANFHFASIGTNYLSAQQPPSPLLNFWSLAVEEQFYLVYPTFFLLVAALRTRWSLRVRLAIGLVAIIAASFILSVVQTASNPTVAYFSPFTRAWELAIGALVAVGTRQLLTLPRSLAAAMTWVGLAAIGWAAVAFNSHTAYPGSLVAIPVVGTALVIAGGASTPGRAAEWLLKRGPLQWFGKLSYSIYLWHWPLLIIASDAAGKTSLPLRRNVVWLLIALAASVVSFHVVENPIRHARFPRLGPWAPICLGVVLIAASVGVATVEIDAHDGPPAVGTVHNPAATQAATNAQVLALVRQASAIQTLPSDLTPTLADVPYDFGGPQPPCWPATGQATIPACVFGDRKADHTMVLYGDSHAGMWFQAMAIIAALSGWRLVYLGKGNCPANLLPYQNPTGFGQSGGEYSVCDAWHRFAIARIRQVHPDLVVITQELRSKPNGQSYSASQWQQGLENTLNQLHVAKNRIVVLGNMPILSQSPPQCLSLHASDVQACSGSVPEYEKRFNDAEQAAAAHAGVRYIRTIPWFCSNTCSPVIGKYLAYFDDYHITAAYSLYLTRALSDALNLSAVGT